MNRRRLEAALALAAACACGCGDDRAAPTSIRLPPGVVAMTPAPRSVGIPHDAIVSITFDRPLDPGSVTATTVLLKVDARRIPIAVSLADSNRTLRARPLERLDVRRTHTMRVRGVVRGADGVALGDDLVWQFTTLGVRPIDWTNPIGADIGPFAPLRWSGTEPTAGRIRYEIHVGEDSARVAAGAGNALHATGNVLMPPVPWPLARTLYWRVRVVNDDTGESALSSLVSFATLDGDTPVDSFLVRPLDTGTWDTRSRSWRCPNVVASSSSIPVLPFELESIGETRPVAGVSLALAPRTLVDQQEPQLWQLERDEIPCRSESGEPRPFEVLASARSNESGTLLFTSHALTARVQARLLGISQSSYTIRTARGSVDFEPFAAVTGIWIRVYRVGSPTIRTGS